MPYLVNIPQPTDNLSVSQGNLLGNFQQLQTTFSVNHFPLSPITPNNGKHTLLQIPNLGAFSTLPAGLAVGDGTLYTNTVNSGGLKTELFYTPDATTNVYQLTRTSNTFYPSFATNTNYATASPSLTQIGGWTFLPGELLMQYGFEAYTGSGNVKFPRPFNNPYYSVQLTYVQGAGPLPVLGIFLEGSPSATGFTWDVQGSTIGHPGFFWMAIGN